MGTTSNLDLIQEQVENLEEDIIEKLDHLMLRTKDENQALEQLLKKLIQHEKTSVVKQNKKDNMQLSQVYELPTQKRVLPKLTLRRQKVKTKVAADSRNRISINELIAEEAGELALQFIGENTNLLDVDTYVSSTTTRFNIDQLPAGSYENIVNLKRINDIRRINKFFESVNTRLPEGGIFIDSVETYVSRKSRILKKYFFPLNWLIYAIDVIITRVLPKLPITKNIYFFLTKGKGRVLSKAETFGRLYSCGFEIVDEKYIGDLLYFAVRKVKAPAFDKQPTYGPLIRLKRIGKNGKLFKVYKLRTMHAYSEYLQDYIYQKNNLQNGGKFKDDFRVTTEGRIFRKFWLDELPMLFNLLKGEMKIVGVRPLSTHYYNLYSEELKQKRILTKPGLIPPFYADMPTSLEEIMDSEIRYLAEYEQKPYLTDMKYFLKAWQNILFKKARSN